MNVKLINRGGTMPPGGFPFVDPRTNMRFDGFDAGGFGDQVLRIIKHRMANPHIYKPEEAKFLTPEDVGNELDAYQCQRLGFDDRFCCQTNEELEAQAKAHAAGICRFCGGILEERLCPTCSGHRVIGYRCTKCGSTL